jgi:hypothetical protein
VGRAGGGGLQEDVDDGGSWLLLLLLPAPLPFSDLPFPGFQHKGVRS